MRQLSNRQMQVQLMLLVDMTVEQIAVELGIAISTVRAHITGIRKRHGIVKRGSAPIALDEIKLAIQLPRRQLQVLKGVIMGKSFLEIASDMNVQIDTVYRHRYRLYKRLGVTTRDQVLAIMAGSEARSEGTDRQDG